MIRNGPSYPGGIPNTKRSRLELPDDYGRYGGGSYNGGAQDLSSRVLNVRNLKDNVMEADLVDALSQFGPISYVSISGRGSAMVEFEDLPAAERCISYTMNTDILVLGQPAVFSYSPLQVIPRQGWESDRPNHVVVMYVQNPKYPITTEVINAICKPICSVVRIIINREDGGIQCLVEFADIDSARNIKQRLNGCDIYSGCCTLKIEFAKLPRLNVTRNDQDQSDYVTPPSALDGAIYNALKDRPALLQEPPVFTGGMVTQSYGSDPFDNGARNDRFGAPGGYDDSGRGLPFRDDAYTRNGRGDTGMMHPPYGEPPMPEGCGMGLDHAVICIYGLDQEKINCDKLFNLLCQYGNVVRIKFLKSKTDTVMVQMGDPVAAHRVIEYLSRSVILGAKITASLSRQPYINEMRDAAELPDKTCSYKDFSNSRLNRFLTPEGATKNRMCHPMKHLYFYHAPPRITPDEFMRILQDNGAPKPVTAKIFESKSESSKTSAGIIEFENEEEATEALIMFNHISIDNESSKYPFVIKLTFAAPQRESVSQQPLFSRRGGVPGRGGGSSFDPDASSGGFRGGRGGDFRGGRGPGGGDFRSSRGGGDFRGGRGRGSDFRGGRSSSEFNGRGRGGDFRGGRSRGESRGRSY